ncbi:MAG: WecB/TagA/CpsF family glycosyltransferase [Candidatus Marinimicrobia bacterium]|nr:WecB/TagA/CpsF family glycosyltransferase [Candidatus Neomarinimicrobiota bacterium]
MNIESIPFGGLRVAACTPVELAAFIGERLRDPQRPATTVNFVNAHVSNLAARDPQLTADLAASSLICADGQSIVWAARIFGARLPGRCNMTDAFRRFLADPEIPVCQAVLIGGPRNLTDLAAGRINARTRRLRVTHSLSGYESPAHQEAFLRDHATTDLVLIGMGSPQSERLAVTAAALCPHALIWHIGGGTVMFLAGAQREAPAWMKRLGIQWLHRLLREPRRMGRRYLLGNPVFVARMLAARLAQFWSAAA